MKKLFYKNHYGYYSLLLILLSVSPSHAIDLQPGEVQASKPGINFAQLAYQYSQRGDRYSHGNKQSDETAIQTSQLQIRLGHSFAIGKYPILNFFENQLSASTKVGCVLRT